MVCLLVSILGGIFPNMNFMPAQLAYLSKMVKAGSSYSDEYFKLTKNLNLNNKTWLRIGDQQNGAGTGYVDFHYAPFSSIFNGNNHTITNLHIASPSYMDRQGLF